MFPLMIGNSILVFLKILAPIILWLDGDAKLIKDTYIQTSETTYAPLEPLYSCDYDCQRDLYFALLSEEQKYTYEELLSMPLKITYYLPSLGGINCGGASCSHYGNGERVKENDNAAACLLSFRGKYISIKNIGDYHCKDSGGLVKVTYEPRCDCNVILIDIKADTLEDTVWNQSIIPPEDWDVYD